MSERKPVSKKKRRTRGTGSLRTPASAPARAVSQSSGKRQVRVPDERRPVRRKRRRMSVKLYAAIMAVLVLGVAVTLCFTVFFNIQTITVTGDSRYDSEQIIKTAGILEGDNLLLADLQAAQEKLLTELPYLETAHIRRKLPTGLSIEVSEAQPEFTFAIDGKYAVVNHAGKVLELTDAPMQSVPLVQGLSFLEAKEGQHYELEKKDKEIVLSDLTNALRENTLLDKTSEIDFSDPVDIRVEYGGNVTMLLGSGSEIDAKIAVGKAAMEKKAEEAAGKKMTLILTATQATVKIEEWSE